MYSNISYTGIGTADAIVKSATEMLKEMYEADTAALIGKMRVATETCYKIK